MPEKGVRIIKKSKLEEGTCDDQASLKKEIDDAHFLACRLVQKFDRIQIKLKQQKEKLASASQG